jgi:beta-lactamase superfamily II metal-dependent hydrolase
MAARKAAAKPRRSSAARTSAKARAKTRSRTAGQGRRKPAQKAAATALPEESGHATALPEESGHETETIGRSLGIRVRMYRVGFGDFFLLTVPGNDGPAHILIDCGVHAANIGSIDECVQDLKKTTKNRLALVILTHYHADHMSGFASNYDDFANFDHIGAVWITNRLDPANRAASKFMAQVTSVAQQLQLRLAARNDREGVEARRKVYNALGIELGAGGKTGDGGNAKALKLLQQGFKSKPPVYYYQGGDTPKLPPELEGRITAEILAPSPNDSGGEFAASDNKKEQYLAAAGENGIPDAERVQPFEKKWPASAADYPEGAFDEFDTALADGLRRRKNDGAARMEAKLAEMQPDVLAAAADKLDGTLNNQSLVVLFTCRGKKLLFVGDAQWGNWAYWLYGKAVTGADPGITARARDILGSIDFYKVGHHGSTNATPIPAVGALNRNSAAMCSTATGAYGKPEKKTEVPRTALMEALETRTGNRLVRSDWVKAAGEEPDPQAKEELPKLPDGFTTPGQLYIDFNL